VSARIDALYRWHLANQQQERDRGTSLPLQRQAFTPELYGMLRRGFSLTPAGAGAHVDFDPFSNSQMSTVGARLLGCGPAPGGALEARVAVSIGRAGQASPTPRVLLYRMEPQPGGAWRIADITYPGEPGFRLSTYLDGLLRSR
jgi:hypothetical protein